MVMLEKDVHRIGRNASHISCWNLCHRPPPCHATASQVDRRRRLLRDSWLSPRFAGASQATLRNHFFPNTRQAVDGSGWAPYFPAAYLVGDLKIDLRTETGNTLRFYFSLSNNIFSFRREVGGVGSSCLLLEASPLVRLSLMIIMVLGWKVFYFWPSSTW